MRYLILYFNSSDDEWQVSGGIRETNTDKPDFSELLERAKSEESLRGDKLEGEKIGIYKVIEQPGVAPRLDCIHLDDPEFPDEEE